MLKHPTLNLLDDLGLHGMAKGFRDLADNPESTALGHAEWLGISLERESTLRQQKRRSKAAPGPPGCAIWRPSRMSTTGRRAVSTARCS